MTTTRAFAIVAASSLLCSIIGGVMGTQLGRLAPGYYRALFEAGRRADFDPVQVGLGLGVTQGLVAGAMIGLGVAAILTWHSTRAAAR